MGCKESDTAAHTCAKAPAPAASTVQPGDTVTQGPDMTSPGQSSPLQAQQHSFDMQLLSKALPELPEPQIQLPSLSVQTVDTLQQLTGTLLLNRSAYAPG